MKECLHRSKPDRLIIIDPDGEYEPFGYLQPTLGDFYRSMQYSTFRTRFRSTADRATAERQFDFICRLVRWQVDPQPGQARPPRVAPVLFVVDELADFIGSSFEKSPASFQWVLRHGRKFGVSFIGCSQRPEEISKTLFSLAGQLRVGRLNQGKTARELADALDVPVDDVRALIGHQFIYRDKVTGELTRGG